MSADLNTYISMQGTAEELLSMLRVLRVFETDNAVRYSDQHDCAYIDMVTISGASDRKATNLKDVPDEELSALVSGAKKGLRIWASGTCPFRTNCAVQRQHQRFCNGCPCLAYG